jgi:hypothetical protein
MCRFNPRVQRDQNNYVFVEANVSDLCAKALAQGELPVSLLDSTPVIPSVNQLERRLEVLRE